jgi:hypothetical protein
MFHYYIFFHDFEHQDIDDSTINILIQKRIVSRESNLQSNIDLSNKFQIILLKFQAKKDSSSSNISPK